MALGILAIGFAATWVLREPLVRMGGRLLYPIPFRDTVVEAATKASVDPLLVVTVMREESGFSPTARSRAGAVGLMQLMPGTARWIAGRAKVPLGDLQDPDTNIRLGTAYLGYLHRQFGDDVPRILAAYNGGEGNVARWKDLSEAFPETRHYVQRGLATYAAYRWLYGKELQIEASASVYRGPGLLAAASGRAGYLAASLGRAGHFAADPHRAGQ